MNDWLRLTLPRALGVVLLGIGVGLAGNQLSLRGLPLITPPKPVQPAEAYLSLERAKLLWQGGAALFLDAREPADYAAGHIGNALNLPAQSFAQHFGAIAPLLSPETELVLYCDGVECELSHRLQASLREGDIRIRICSSMVGPCGDRRVCR